MNFILEAEKALARQRVRTKAESLEEYRKYQQLLAQRRPVVAHEKETVTGNVTDTRSVLVRDHPIRPCRSVPDVKPERHLIQE